MEEYFYEYIKSKSIPNATYIPVFWTNLQNHPNFQRMRSTLSQLLREKIEELPKETQFFTVVQHDDGALLWLPPNTMIFGACTGHIPLPLIYEDTTCRLVTAVAAAEASITKNDHKSFLASFIGTITHNCRKQLYNVIQKNPDIETHIQTSWVSNVPTAAANLFINTTLKSKFCLAPRGYGRSSFRFFEAMLLNTIPVYIWDDIEWLPYKELLDYSKFSVSIPVNQISNIVSILKSISNETYLNMLSELEKHKKWFTLEGMSKYIIWKVTQNSDILSELSTT